ncbi:hypothetical protein SMONO_v1c01380 [Spiroplasma monobiae MQ-1]|uniref:Uncharacterized protein n=1 Tax=Spiroplasma monobiae MQ-1 TaxID=1336748 RepID=A0A2K9LTI2_SPISQ|nr:hypothetical protein SMONO_v1c01380 [Spiroplasma monobiae MQ-1]
MSIPSVDQLEILIKNKTVRSIANLPSVFALSK